ncbi:WbqC family protein [Winogradskyella vincentii]|uniref:WbqC family protein n=1 Tax=Winogradskyella vincentii TaxID=2877122 RepID=A0ABS7Y0D9_9FLAO|nr:WbqC family protein [Winogradskyella vincentii]MCA0153378.1 WbqC family protein [Winogradskyella vincentii]
MQRLLHPTYFPNIAHVVAAVNADKIYFEICDNYQKQTFRNRFEIYGANGKLALTVPVIYTQKNRQLYKDVKIANENDWQKIHLKSLESAYRMSPFYEFYIDDIMPIFEDNFKFILDLNLKCFEIITESLQLDLNLAFTNQYENSPSNVNDYRHLVNKKFNAIKFEPYTQVFSQKHGFIPNLSILDLLFNEGPNTELYLTRQQID